MKFMKLGSKPDSFRTEVNNVRYVASELEADIIVNVGDVKFYLHKFPLLSKSSRLQKLVTSTTDQTMNEVHITDIPGGPAAFEICAKFCYNMTVTLNAYNVVTVRCAAEYLQMHETAEKGNLIYKVDVFMNSSIFHSWKDSIIVLQTSKHMLHLSEEIKVVSRCIESIASKACIDVARVDWSYSYNRKKLKEEDRNDLVGNVARTRPVPKDWWVEDLCELEIDMYKQIIVSIKSKGAVSSEVIGEALKAYAYKKLYGFSIGKIRSGEAVKYQVIVDAIVSLLPIKKGSVSCSFMIKLLKAAIFVGSGSDVTSELVRRIGKQLEEASASDLLIRGKDGEGTMYNVGIVQDMVREFLDRDKKSEIELSEGNGVLLDGSKLMVAKVVDEYLAEIGKDRELRVSQFVELAEMVSGVSRPVHDGIYRAIDMFLKEHPGISKSERKRICKLMDCKKLSADASTHAVQNERLPLRVVVQVLFFEQVRAAAASGASTPDLPKGIKDLSHGSSRTTTTNTEEDWDAVATTEELKALKSELAGLKLSNDQNGVDKAAASRTKGLMMSRKIFTRIWSARRGRGDNSGSDSSDSLGSLNHDEAKSTPSRNRRYSVS